MRLTKPEEFDESLGVPAGVLHRAQRPLTYEGQNVSPGHVEGLLHFVGVGLDGHILAHKEDVVDFILPPGGI